MGDLPSIGAARPLPAVGRDGDAWPRALVSIAGLSMVALLVAGAAYLGVRLGGALPTAGDHAAPVAAAGVRAPATFPPVEVPYLAGPPSRGGAPDAGRVAEGPRSFLGPDAAGPARAPVVLPPRADPRLPLIGLAPLDAARWTREVLPARTERADRAPPVPAPTVPSNAVPTLDPGPAQTARVADGPTVRPLSADPVDVPVSTPDAAPRGPAGPPAPLRTVALPPEPAAVLDPAPQPRAEDRDEPTARTLAPVTVPPAQPPPAATLDPGPSRPARDRIGPTRPTPAGASPVPARPPVLTRPPVAARQAGSPERARPHTPPRDVARQREVEQTASIAAAPGKPARPRIDAGAVAHASPRQSRSPPTRAAARPAAPSAPWTLPSVLAPSD